MHEMLFAKLYSKSMLRICNEQKIATLSASVTQILKKAEDICEWTHDCGNHVVNDIDQPSTSLYLLSIYNFRILPLQLIVVVWSWFAFHLDMLLLRQVFYDARCRNLITQALQWCQNCYPGVTKNCWDNGLAHCLWTVVDWKHFRTVETPNCLYSTNFVISWYNWNWYMARGYGIWCDSQSKVTPLTTQFRYQFLYQNAYVFVVFLEAKTSGLKDKYLNKSKQIYQV